jgi:hypothetical protein
MLVGVHRRKLLALGQVLVLHGLHGHVIGRRRRGISATLSALMSAVLTRVATRMLLDHFLLFVSAKKKDTGIEMEPEWTKNISSETICNFFYFFYVVYAVLAIFALVSFASMFLFPLPKGVLLITGIQGLLMVAIATTTALFHYLVCSRALLPATR